MAAKGYETGDEAGKGFFAILGSWVYWVLVIELLLLLTCLPTFLCFLLTGWTGTGALIAGLSLVFVGPGIAAALFAWRKRFTDPDMSPVKHFFRGYAVSLKDVILWWIPWTILVTAISMALLNRDSYDGPWWILAFSGVVLIVLVLLGAHLLSLSALFNFRLRDRVQLAVFCAIMHPVATLGYAALVFLGGLLVWQVGDLVLALAVSLFTMFAYLNGVSVEKDVTRRFIQPAAEEETGPGDDDSSEETTS